MTKVNAIKLMQESFDSMQRSGMIEEGLTVQADTVILGAGSTLDSLGFVTFISELEDRLCAATGMDYFLILTDIHDANSDQAYLSADALASYIEQLKA